MKLSEAIRRWSEISESPSAHSRADEGLMKLSERIRTWGRLVDSDTAQGWAEEAAELEAAIERLAPENLELRAEVAVLQAQKKEDG